MSYCRLTLFHIKGDFTTNRNYLFTNPSHPDRRYIQNFLQSSYIVSEDTLIINDYQYLKHSINLDIKINYSQDNYLASSESLKKYNYVRIEWRKALESGYEQYDTAYYFINKAEWASQGAIRLSLEIDVLNSFRFNFGQKTHISREHKNRYRELRLNADESAYVGEIIVDPINEGINPALFRKSKTVIEDSQDNESGLKWYLIYKNEEDINPSQINQVNPVQCILSRNKPFNLKIKETAEINTSDAGGNYFTFALQNNGNHPFTIKILDGNDAGRVLTPRSNLWISMYNGGVETIDSALNVHIYPCTKISIDSNETNVYYYSSALEPSTPPTTTSGSYSTANYTSVSGMTIDMFDRTDSKMIKIVELPYCPVPFAKDNTGYQFNNFTYDSINHLLLLNNLDVKFTRNITTSINNPMQEIAFQEFPADIKTALHLTYGMGINIDPKLYSSEFYQCKILYDSFSYSYNMEDITYRYYGYSETPLVLRYSVSSAISSKFIIKDENTEAWLLKAEEDYPFTLISQRNNELVLYTNQFVNYIRNGYNYDVKAKNLQTKYALIQTTPQIIGGLAGLATGNVLGIGLTATASSNILKIIKDRETTQNSINKKIQESRAQATSVEGADDLDLLNIYNGNRLIKMEYSPNEETIDALKHLFYLYGYKSDRYVLNVDFLSGFKRRLFNYIECDEVDIEYNSTSEFNSSDIEDMISNRYKMGMYYIWEYEAGTFNIDFKYENIEMEVQE